MSEASQVIRDYFTLTGKDFLKKYPKVEEEAYWNGEDGEGLMQALEDYLPVEPVQLEVLGEEELAKVKGCELYESIKAGELNCENCSGNCRKVSQATVAHNEAKGQLYPEGRMKKDTIWIDISLDGDKWCALVGDNIQEGIVGFGDTPLEALESLLNEFRTTPWNLPNFTIG